MNSKRKGTGMLLLDARDSLLLVVDVQERLWPQISNRESVRDRCRTLMQGAQRLEVPVLLTEQYPQGLGPTLPELKESLPASVDILEKRSFSCLGEEALRSRIEQAHRRQLVVCGIEAHVCVLQTVLEALERGLRAAVVADAIGSRDEANRQLAIQRMSDSGATVVSVEMVLFEWMRTARHPAFKAISALVK